MFHNVLIVEYVVKMKKYTNAHYTAGIFVNFSLFIGCVVVSFMRMIYLKIFRVEGFVAVSSQLLLTSLKVLKDPSDWSA